MELLSFKFLTPVTAIQHISMRKRSPKTKAIRAASPQGPEIAVLQPPRELQFHHYCASAYPLAPVAGSPAPPVIAPPTAEYVDNMALDNWQEATIILCFAAIGIIYLICSRANGSDDGNEKKPDLAKKHLS